MHRGRPSGHRRITASVVGQVYKIGKERPSLSGFLAGFAGNTSRLKELSQLDLLSHIERGRLDPKFGNRNLGLIELPGGQVISVVNRPQVACGMQDDQRSIHRITRPAIRAVLECQADLFSFLARPCK